jgi:hypothetical protein
LQKSLLFFKFTTFKIFNCGVPARVGSFKRTEEGISQLMTNTD